MVSYRSVLFFFLCAYVLTACRPGTDTLKNAIQAELEQQQGIFAVAFKDLSSGQQVLIREHDVFHAASTMKTPVMIEVFKQCASEKYSLSDSIVIKNDFRSIVDGSPFSLNADGDSDQQLYNQIGRKETLSLLVHKMIVMSSNLATNIIIELVEADKVTQTMREIGARDINVLRGVEDSKAFDKGLVNTVTAYDLMLLYEKLALGEVVDEMSSQAMIDILSEQHFNGIIPAKLPANVNVAHKTGNITGVLHDSGIIFLPDGRKYVLVLLSRDLKDTEGARDMMARVSGLIYEHVMSMN